MIVPMLLRGEAIEADVLPDLGMSIVSLRDSSGREQLWRRPNFSPPPRRREIGPPGEASIEAMFALWPGGWFEMSPHAGLPGELDGRETMLHGEAARLPWEVLDAGPGHLEAQVDAVHEPLRLWRRVEAEADGLLLRSRIENRGDASVEVCHGEHPAFARPDFAGARIELRARRAVVLPQLDPPAASLVAGEFEWPLAPAVGGGTVDLSLVPEHADGAHDHLALELAEPRARIVRVDGSRLEIDAGNHSHLMLWRHHQPVSSPEPRDIFALEPMSFGGVTITEAVAAGATRRLAPGETATYESAVHTSP
jgi:galactose mutarotase-like enzyme